MVPIFNPRTFTGAPYSGDGDWTVSALPEVAVDLREMGLAIVSRANNHAQDWGLEGMRETSHWLDEAGISHAGAGETRCAVGQFDRQRRALACRWFGRR